MVYEIEKRCVLFDDGDFLAIKERIEKSAVFKERKIMKTFLFPGPPYFMRIRMIQWDDMVYIQQKSGSLHDSVREESSYSISFDELSDKLGELTSQWFHSCVAVNTDRLVYGLQNLNIEISTTDVLGYIVEVEATTHDTGEIGKLETQVSDTMEKLGLVETSGEEYQRIVDTMYNDRLLPIDQWQWSM